MLHKMGPDLLLNPNDLVLLFATVDAHAYNNAKASLVFPKVPGHPRYQAIFIKEPILA